MPRALDRVAYALDQSFSPEAIMAAAGLEVEHPEDLPPKPAARVPYSDFCESLGNWTWTAYRHLVADQCQRILDGDLLRLAVVMPPQTGKSETVIRRLVPAWLHERPRTFAGICAHTADLSRDELSFMAREYFEQSGGVVRTDARARKLWRLPAGGGCWSGGIDGPVAGFPAHLGALDDPIKLPSQAASSRFRQGQKDWYDTIWAQRRGPGAPEVFCTTRWHVDDLLAHALGKEHGPKWTVVLLSAFHRDDLLDAYLEYAGVGEVLTIPRAEGEPLGWFSDEEWEAKWANTPALWRAALLDGWPVVREGSWWQRSWFPIVEAPAGAPKQLVRYWDTAASKDGGAERAKGTGDGDATAGVLMAEYQRGFVILHVDHFRESTGARDRRIVQRAAMDAETYGGRYKVRQIREQEGAASGKDKAHEWRKLLRGYRTGIDKPNEKLEGRSESFRSECELRGVGLVAGEWNADFLTELAEVPLGPHDDQASAATGAYNWLTGRRHRLHVGKAGPRRRRRRKLPGT